MERRRKTRFYVLAVLLAACVLNPLFGLSKQDAAVVTADFAVTFGHRVTPALIFPTGETGGGSNAKGGRSPPYNP
jgi:hypothetical protein